MNNEKEFLQTVEKKLKENPSWITSLAKLVRKMLEDKIFNVFSKGNRHETR